MKSCSQKTKSCAAQVPDTLDLAARAELALSGLCGTVDPDNDYLMYFEVFTNTRPPFMLHSGCDTECAPKYMDAILKMRAMCGSDKFADIEDGMLKALTGYFEDGLYYDKYTTKRPWRLTGYHDAGYITHPEDYALPMTSLMMVLPLMHLDEINNNTRWDD